MRSAARQVSLTFRLKIPRNFKYLSVSADYQGLPEAETTMFSSGGPQLIHCAEDAVTLATLPIGAHLILRCRTDWRDATVIRITCDSVTISVGSPNGRTYRVRRPPDAHLSFDGLIPVLGEGSWRAGLARYDARW